MTNRRGSLPYLIRSFFLRGLLLGAFISCTALIIGLAFINEQSKPIVGAVFSIWFFQCALLPFARLHNPLVLFLEFFTSGPIKFFSGYKTVDIAEMVGSYVLLIGGTGLGFLFLCLTILEIQR